MIIYGTSKMKLVFLLSLLIVPAFSVNQLVNFDLDSNKTNQISEVKYQPQIFNEPRLFWIPRELNSLSYYKVYSSKLLDFDIIRTSRIDLHLSLISNQIFDLSSSRFTLDSLNHGEFIQNDKIVQFEIPNEDILGLKSLWDSGYYGNNTVVAIIDTGVDFSHPSLIGKKYREKSFVNEDYGYSTNEDPNDYFGHGTSVASLVSGFDKGILDSLGMAPGSKLFNIKIYSKATNEITAAGLIAAIDWAASDENVDIINISVGEPEDSPATDVLEEIVNAAVAVGKIVVASAGNDGAGGSQIRDPYTIGSPGSAIEAISVGAITNSLNIGYLSSEGPSMGGTAKPDVMAPGIDIKVALTKEDYSICSGDICYRQRSGTSFSSPLTAGALSVIISGLKISNVEYTPGSIKSALMSTATNLGYDWTQQGSGVINATATFNAIIADTNIALITPQSIPSYINYEIPAGEKMTFPLTMISSYSNEWVLDGMIGNASNYLQFTSSNLGKYSRRSFLTFSSSEDIPLGIYSAEISFINHQTNLVSTYLELNITKSAKYRLLLDLAHTPWDSVIGSSKSRLDRKVGKDMVSLVNLMKSMGIWVEEFIGGNLTEDILDYYDAIMMPSVFTIVNPVIFDHKENRDTLLTNEELFALYKFKQRGGKFIIDFAGVSNNDDEFEYVIPHEKSLISLLSIFGIKVENVLQDSRINTIKYGELTHFNGYQSVSGNINIKNGIRLLPSNEINSHVLYVGENSDNAIIINNRNWRDATRMSDTQQLGSSELNHQLLNWLFDNNQLDNFKINYVNNVLDITGSISADNFNPELFNLQAFYKGEILNTDSVKISESGVFSAQIANFKQNKINISISYGDQKYLFEKELNIELPILTAVSHPSLSEIEKLTEVTSLTWVFEFDNLNILEFNYIVSILDKQVNKESIIINSQRNEIEISVSVKPGDSYPNLIIEIIDDLGNYHIFNSDEIISPTTIQSTKSKKSIFDTFSLLVMMSSILLIKLKKRKIVS